ncbi:hypothetical protein HY624_00050, partial [Candidatus Uhrbacteria bacterium]|nr:hypothetical protein [Candidatus Uhrbacteria bacterium]
MSLWLNEHPKKRKTIVMIVLVAFVLQIALTPQLAFAQLVVADPPSMIQRALQWLKEGYTFIIEKALKVAAWKAFQTALQRFLGRIAYETAVWIGSGDKGKKPLLYTKGWKQYLEDAGDAAAGDFIETLADEWSGQADRKKEAIELQKDLEYQNALFANRECSRYGPGSSEYELPRSAVPGSTLPGNPDAVPDTFSTSCLSIAKERVRVQKELNDINTTIARTAPFLAAICTPPDGIQLKIALGLGTPTSPTAPKCTFSKMRDNWEKAVDDPAFLEKFSVSFHPSQSDLGVALDLQSNLLIEQDKRKINEQLTRSADGAFKSVTSTVTGAIQTPARLIDKKMEQVIEDANAAQKEQPPPGLLEGVATIFTTTLVSSLKDRMMKGFWNLREVAEKKKSPNLGGLGGRGGQSEVEAVFTSLKQVKLQENTNFDIVSQFQQCPTELKQQMNVYACVLDANFADAIRRGRGEPMTVREAMEEGLLQGAWNFGYDDPAQGREPAFNSGYAYSSMVKLRRFRIIPVGWEFAAEYIRGRNQPYTLEHVVNCFESADDPINSTWPIECQEQAKVDINKDGVINAQDQWNPFWHLVDPNWVLKAPQTNCRAWGPGQQVYKETGQRLDYCSDAQDCVVESDNGTCAAWGYCTREKNVWRFAGDTCDAQYDTCLNVRKEGTDEALSALQSSWDRAGCTQDTSGCAAHALQTFDASKQNRDGSKGAWVNTAKQRYLTSQAPSCAERAVGCRAFIEPRAGVNLVPNGNFERGDEGILPPGWDAPGTTLTKSLPIAQRGQAAILAKDFAGLHVAGAQQATATTGILGILPDHTYT